MTIDLLKHLHVLDDLARQRAPIFVALDFDGTIAPISDSPAGVTLSPEMVEVLHDLSCNGRVTVGIVSGRSLEDLRSRVLAQGIVLAGNHGLEIMAPDWSFIHPEVQLFRSQLDTLCEKLHVAAAKFEGAWVENKRLTATVHYRKLDPRLHRQFKGAVAELVRQSTERFAITSASMALEIRPPIAWEKGSAVRLMRIRSGLDKAACICIGDDTTDEAMFRQFHDQVTIVVGQAKSSLAKYRIPDPTGVQLALCFLRDCLTVVDRHYERHARHCYAPEATWGRGA